MGRGFTRTLPTSVFTTAVSAFVVIRPSLIHLITEVTNMTHPNRIRLSKLSLGLLVALAAAPAFAQSTSAGVGGQVMGADGQPVSGAEVTITHVASGTVSRMTTDASGRYNARGLRVGGPYTITVNKAGAGSDTEENVYLTLSQVNTVDAKLNNDVTTLESVQAVASGVSVFSSNKMGSGTSVDLTTIEATPSQGNIQDLMRLDPRISFVDRASGSITAGGQNPRYNNIRIDGVSASDTFGLEGNNLPTKRQPVALEAIEAVNIDLSNYDVSMSGATGAVVDAVTKSGTNQFHGAVYGKWRDGDWFGKDPKGNKFNGFTKESDYGFILGGPIIKDRLFFFVNYDKFHQGAPGADIGGSPLGRTPPGITQADVAAASAAATGFGMHPGTLDSAGDLDLEEYAAKIDWNISDSHRLNFRYSHLEQSKLRINGFNSSQASLSSYWFQHNKAIDSYVGQLFSDWSDNFSTEVKVSYRDYSAIRVTPTNDPSVRINFGRDSLFLGTETNSQANQLYTKTWNAFGAGTWTSGSHDVKFGFDWSSNEIYNLFAPSTLGVYEFNNLADFQAGKWSRFQYRTPQPGADLSSLAADYTYKNLGLFVQDQWYVNSNLTLTFGVRADKGDTNSVPSYNAGAAVAPSVNPITGVSTGGFGYNNSEIGLGKWLFQPRMGFNYTFDGDRQMQLRGGIGLFMGDSPQVWVANAFNTTGLNYVNYNVSATPATYPYTTFPKFDGTAEAPAVPGLATQNVSFTSPDFEQPSVWKANLGFETETGWMDTVFSAEVLVTEVKNALVYKNLNLGSATGQGQDGRDLFYTRPAGCVGGFTSPTCTVAWNSNNRRPLRNPGFDQVYLIDTSSVGGSQQLTVSLAKPWSNASDWSWTLGYTYTHATEANGLTSSTVTSNWAGQPLFQANEVAEARSRYEIKDRVTGQLTWKHNFFGDYRTQVGLVYEGRTGRPYSYIYFNDANGDSAGSSGSSLQDLFYVPAGPGDVLFGTLSSTGVFTSNPTAEGSFFDWLGKQDDLQQYKGKVVPAYSGRANWVNTVDLRISQELPGFFKGHKSEIWIDVQNIGNLLNKNWGEVIDYGFFATQRVASLQGVYKGKYVYDFRSPDAPTVANGDSDSFNTGISQWSVQVGFKYKF